MGIEPRGGKELLTPRTKEERDSEKDGSPLGRRARWRGHRYLKIIPVPAPYAHIVIHYKPHIHSTLAPHTLREPPLCEPPGDKLAAPRLRYTTGLSRALRWAPLASIRYVVLTRLRTPLSLALFLPWRLRILARRV